MTKQSTAARKQAQAKQSTAKKKPSAEIIKLAERIAESLNRPRVPREPSEAEKREAEYDRRKETEEREGVTLKGKRLEQARKTLSDINIGALSACQLAIAAMDGDHQATGAFLSAIENIAKVICRKADVIDALLGGECSFGNFEDEFAALTPEEAEKLEREERDRELREAA
jgi:hypothetical protein